MNTQFNYALVGAFVLCLMSAIIIAIAWLSAGTHISHYALYKVYMSESVSGINIDSPVEFNGVNVGNVSSIDINHTNPHLVELMLRIKSDTPLTDGTRATLNSRGLTGTTYIALQDRGDDLKPLKLKPGETYPVILTSPSLFFRLDHAVSELANDMHEVTKSIQSILNPTNKAALQQTLTNMRDITNTIATNTASINATMQNTAQSMQTLDQQTLPAANTALRNINLLTSHLANVANQIEQNPAILIRGRTPMPLGPGETP